MKHHRHGFTLIEVMIALAVIMIAVAALAFVQVTNLRASVNARLLTETKAAANVVLEELMAEVLVVAPNPSSVTDFTFFHYYWSCPTLQLPSTGVPDPGRVTCSGERRIDDVRVRYVIRGENGILGEGILTITVTGEHVHRGQTLTIGNRITCYDVYPSPSSTAPEPCPRPTGGSGGGRA